MSLKQELKNGNVSFSSDIYTKLGNSKSEKEIIQVLKDAGVSNSIEIVSLLKSSAILQNEFRMATPGFYRLNSKQQADIYQSEVDEHFSVIAAEKLKGDAIKVVGPGSEGPTCESTFNTTLDRCDRDYYICAGFAIGSAYVGILPGLVAGAYCMITFSNCQSDATADLNSCRKSIPE